MKVTFIQTRQRGFALPTILIASVIMLTVLVAAISASSSVRSGLDSQYYNKLASEAAESGVAYAQDCMSKNSGVPQWSDSMPLRPNTDCAGTKVAGLPAYVMSTSEARTTFTVGFPDTTSSGVAVNVSATGTIELLRKSTGTPWKSQQSSYVASVSPDTTAPPPPVWKSYTLQSGWVDYGAPYAAHAYTKTGYGEVFLKGLIKSGSDARDTTIFVLPPGYRPDTQLAFHVGSDGNGVSGIGRIDVLPTGEVRFIDGSNAWISLDSVHFMASNSCNQNILTLQNGWANWNGGFAPLSVCQDPSQRIHVQGLVKAGNAGSGVVIGPMPSGYQPPENLLFTAADNTGVFGSFGVYTNDAVVARGQLNSFLSTMATYYPASYTNWTDLPLQNGWTTFDPGWSPLRYTKSADGVVSLKGLIKGGATYNGVIIGTLPAGYRPKERLLLSSVALDHHLRVDISANGVIDLDAGAEASWTSLDDITFIADQ